MILNTLEHIVTRRRDVDQHELEFALDVYDLLGEIPPGESEIIEGLNQRQTENGMWVEGQPHFVPITAQAYMYFKRRGQTPRRSLDRFFEAVDTWDKLKQRIEKYGPPSNRWGELWGYVTLYTFEGRQPPWLPEFSQALEEYFDDWASRNHQRIHVLDMLEQLSMEVPRAAEVLEATLRQQNPDGSWSDDHWENPIAQTFFAIHSLRILQRKLPDHHAARIEEAIQRGLTYIQSCATTVTHEQTGRSYSGFGKYPGDILPRVSATFFGLAAFDPDGFEEFLRKSGVRPAANV